MNDMEKIVEMKPGDTLVGLFDKVERGKTIHVKGLNYESVRSEAARNNKLARLLKEVGPYDRKFTISKVLMEGYISITHTVPAKEKIS